MPPSPIAALTDALDRRVGRRADPPSVWPTDFWSLVGHTAVVAFLVLTATGIALALVYRPSTAPMVYQGSSELYDGQTLPTAFASIVYISEDVPGGQLLRRLHVAASHVFLLAIVAHLLRTLATGAFRRPRLLIHTTGVGLLLVALGFSYTGELLPFGLVAGSSLRIAEAVMYALPFAGQELGALLFAGELPSDRFLLLSWATHVFVLPLAFVGLLLVHLVLVHRRRPALAERRDVDVEVTAVGRPLWPDAVARFALLTAALTALLLVSAVLVPWSDAELEGPFRTAEATNSVHPPWPLFFLTGGLRIVPGIDLVIGGVRITNVLVAGVVIPGLLVAGVALYPLLERWLRRDDAAHHRLDHPLDVPLRAGTVAGLTTLTIVLSLAAGIDVLAFWLRVPVEAIVVTFRVLALVLPVAAATAAVAASRRRGRHGPGTTTSTSPPADSHPHGGSS